VELQVPEDSTQNVQNSLDQFITSVLFNIKLIVFAVDPLNSREEDGQLMTKMFNPLGLCYQTEESKINAYCALFGSGIGFVSYL